MKKREQKNMSRTEEVVKHFDSFFESGFATTMQTEVLISIATTLAMIYDKMCEKEKDNAID